MSDIGISLGVGCCGRNSGSPTSCVGAGPGWSYWGAGVWSRAGLYSGGGLCSPGGRYPKMSASCSVAVSDVNPADVDCSVECNERAEDRPAGVMDRIVRIHVAGRYIQSSGVGNRCRT